MTIADKKKVAAIGADLLTHLKAAAFAVDALVVETAETPNLKYLRGSLAHLRKLAAEEVA